MSTEVRFQELRTEWSAMTELPPPDRVRFDEVRLEAEAIIEAGLWSSGPADMLTVLGRHRDELMHSRMISWLLVPTHRHGLGRAFLTGLLDRLWPGDLLMRSGAVLAETEVSLSALDEGGRLREARADIVIQGEGPIVVIENKLDAGEGSEQCERLYWAWAAEPGEVRWVFLTPTGRQPVTATSDSARAAWRTLAYADVREILSSALERTKGNAASGRPTAIQYLSTLAGVVAP
jgi:hypothetical protein